MLILPVVELNLSAPETYGNVAEKLDVADRRRLATDLIELIENVDAESMSTWSGEAEGYLDDLDAEDKNETPQDREQEGSNEEPPPSTEMTLSAVIQFAARATDALLGEPDLAKASEEGDGNIALAAWVSRQLRTEDPNWTLDTDPLTVHMAVTGLSWRKRDFDDVEKVFHSHFIPSCGEERVIINKNVRSYERAPRITHEFSRYPYEIERSIGRKKWVDYDPQFDEQDPQAPKKFYECDAWLDMDGDGYEEPWTVTISRDDNAEVVRLRPRWSKKTVTVNAEELFFNPIVRFYPYRMLPDPKGGFLPMGFGKILHRVESTADNLLGAIIDTAESAAEDGGVFGGSSYGLPDKIELKNNRMTSIPIEGKLTDNLQMFPMKQVSAGTVQVLEKVMTLGDRLAGTLNLLENAPASMTATMAKGIIDSGQQVQSAVHRRMCASMTQEIRAFVRMADAYDQLPPEVSAANTNSVAVTADPQLATEMQRSALGGVYMELLKDPLTKWDEVRLRLYQTLRLPQPKKLLGSPPEPQATPKEKMDGYVAMLKQRTENIKVTGAVAVQLTQALLNMVQAAGGMQNNQMALLTMAQLEHAVQSMMNEAGNAGNDVNGMAQQPGNPSAPGNGPAPQGDGSPPLLNGPALGPDQTGAGGGVA